MPAPVDPSAAPPTGPASPDRYRAILHHGQQGFGLVEVLFDAQGTAVDFRLLEVNAAFERQTGLADPVGHTLRELVPEHGAEWFAGYGQVARTGQPQQFEQQVPQAGGRWFEVQALPGGPAGSHQVAILLADTTARHQAEAARQRSSHLLLDMEAVARTGSYEADLLSGSFYFSDGLYRLFGEAPQAFEVTLEAIDARSNPDDVATVRQVLDEAVRTGRPYTYRRRIRRADGAWRTLEAHGEVRRDANGRAVQLRGLVQDITERVQAEAALHESRTLLRATIDSSLDMVQVFEAVRDEQGAVVDFTWVLNNAAAERYYGNVLGQRLCERNPGVVPEGIFDTFRQVLETGVPDQSERHYVHEQFDGWFYQSTVKLGDGVATTTHDISERKRAHEEIVRLKDELAQQATDKYHALFRSMNQGFCVLEILFDDTGQRAIGFNALEVNPRFAQESGMAAYAAGETLPELVPALDDFWLAAYGQVVRTGEPHRQERYEPRVKRWFDVHAFRVGPPAAHQVAVLFSDISARKQAEQRQEFLLHFSDALRAEPTVDGVANRALHLLGEQLELDRSYITTYYLDENRADVDYQIGNDRVPPLPAHFVLSDYPDAFETTLTNTIVIEDDFERQGLTEAEQRNSAKLGMRAMVGATLRKEHHPLWSLVAISAQPRRWTPGDIALVEEVAERTWAALVRARAEAALRESEEQFRTVANLVPDLLWRSTPDSDTTWYNQQWYDYTGQTPETAAGYGWTEAIHPDDRAESARRYRAALASGQLLRQEHRIRSAQGEYRWFQVQARALRTEHGAVTAWYGAATDIHARKQVEEALRQSEEKYRTLFDSIDEGFALEELVYDANGEIADIIFREVNRAYERQSGLTNVVGKSSREVLPNMEQHWKDVFAQVARTGEPVRLINYAQDVGRWFDTYITLLSGSKQYVAVIFNDITERKQREQQQEFLLMLSDALRAQPTAEAIGTLATRLVAEYLRADRCYIAQFSREQEVGWIGPEYRAAELPPLSGKYRFADFPEGMKRIETGPLVIRDLLRDPDLSDTDKQSMGQLLGVQGMLAAVLREGERNYFWCLTAATTQPRAWTEADVKFLQNVAERTWAAMERANIEEELRASEEKYRRIFENIDQGFSLHELLVDESGQVTDVILQEVNEAFEKHTGLKNAQGKKASELVPNLEQGWLDAMTRAYKWGESQYFEAYNADTNRWLTSQYSRIGGAGSRLLSTVFTDVTERKQREQHQDFLLKLSDALRSVATSAAMERAALHVLGETLGADRVFLATMQADGTSWRVREEYTTGLPGFIGSYPLSEFQLKRLPQWQAGQPSSVADSETDPTFSAADRAAYAAFGLRAAIGVPLVKGGRFTALLCVNQATPRRWTAAELALAREAAERIWVALERARAEEALAASEARLRALITNLPGAAAFVVGPDLRYQLAGGEALDKAGLVPADLVGRTVAEAMPPELVPQYEAHYRQALAGQDFSLEHTAHGRTFVSRGVPLLDTAGQPEAVLVVSYDITARKQAEEALVVSELKYRTLFESMDQGFGIGQVLPADEATGAPLDWQWLEVNPQFERLTGLPRADVLSQTTRRLIPGLEEIWYERYAQAAAGETVNFEAFSPVLDRWFDVYAFGLGPPNHRRVAVLFSNISEQKQTEAALHEAEARYREQLEQQVIERTQQLQENRDLLQSVLDTSLISMSVLYAVRNEAGQVQDFRIGLVNKELERETGRADLVGKFYAQEYPGIRQVGIFDLMLQVMATGEPQGMEYFYDHEGFNRWFTCQFVKLGDGVAATNLDITERRIAEQERLKNLRLLEQAEAVAGLGSWDYDLATGLMRWSDGMYHLFGLPVGSTVAPSHYLDAVLPDDRPRARQLVRRLTAGEGFEETLRLRVREQVKTVRMKAVVLRDEAGPPARVLGVDLDISELQRLEADNLQLRLGQQQALFEAVQVAQEEERRRMGESLHNGLGQVLFATKLQLDRLGAEPASPARHEAARLLSDAIRQTRALSHELSPTLLEEFGLQVALETICRQLNAPSLHWHCHIVVADAVLPRVLQLAIYRLAQGLAHNVAQHAQASEATLEVERLPGWIVLRVEDNGRGFDPATVQEGLGLKTLHSRAGLLGGVVQLDSAPGQGTQVLVRLPVR